MQGSLTEDQFRVLLCRGKGMTQKETAAKLGKTRANVSMIEHRARMKVALARETLKAFRSTMTGHTVRIPKGTMLYEVPSEVLKEGDRWGVHIESNMVDIVRMVKGIKPDCLRGRRTARTISFTFNQAGKLRLGA